MFGSRRSALIAVLLTLATAAFADEAQPKVTVSISETTIRAAGLTPRGHAVVFASLTGTYARMPKLSTYREVVAVGEAGEIELMLNDLPITSVWAIVDFDSGRFAVATPPGFPLRQISLPDHGWRGGKQFLEARRDYLDLLVVRPGVGAWTLQAAEGGALDADRSLNTNLRIRLEDMTRLFGDDARPKPPVVVPRDLIIVIDPHELDYFAHEAPQS